jgi:DnaJ family protein C protein 19
MGYVFALLLGTVAWFLIPAARRPAPGRVAGFALVLLGVVVALRGSLPLGGGLIVAGLVWLGRRAGKGRPQQSIPAMDPKAREALELLGLPIDADRAAVIDAHRRLIARTHPDTGGTEALARTINQARDYLLERLPR